MARKRKDPSQWSESYRKRIERAYERNPFISLDEARGHKKKPPKEPPTNAPTFVKREYEKERTFFNIKAKESNIYIREAVGDLTKKEAEKARYHLKKLKEGIEKKTEKPGTRSYKESQNELKYHYHELAGLDLFGGTDDEYGDIFYR